jgi:hypothetical protein
MTALTSLFSPYHHSDSHHLVVIVQVHQTLLQEEYHRRHQDPMSLQGLPWLQSDGDNAS